MRSLRSLPSREAGFVEPMESRVARLFRYPANRELANCRIYSSSATSVTLALMGHGHSAARIRARRREIAWSLLLIPPVESWLRKPWPLGVLLFGLVMLVLAVIGTFTGKTYGKGGSADLAKDPSGYWLMLVVQYLCAVFLILYWFYRLPH
jgi:sterol desaturase/sphingolipid hydroxylase (fatty acid hydroxylase superfamily)